MPSQTRLAIEAWAERHDLAVTSRVIITRPVAQGWNAIEAAGKNALGCCLQGIESTSEVVVIARDRTVAEDLCECEVSGETMRAGELLGYPACCVAAYSEHSRRPGEWIAAALERTEARPPRCWCNRLPLARNAPTLVGEIYPCSFACDALTALGVRVHELLVANGLRALAQRTLEESLRPVCFRPDRPHPADSAMMTLVVDDPRLPNFIEFSI